MVRGGNVVSNGTSWKQGMRDFENREYKRLVSNGDVLLLRLREV